MNITIVTPAPAGSRKGNRITARRWAGLLRQLGHRVALRQGYQGERCDLLIALHAGHSSDALQAFHSAHPERPIILALTGTDLYEGIHTNPVARQALELASRFVVLQPLGIEELPHHLRDRACVIYQSTEAMAALPRRRTALFEVCVIGHLRPVKDPFRTAQASRLLPPSSRLRVLHFGAALSPDMAKQARVEAATNSRYRWLGDQPRAKVLRALARCRLLALTSRLEGGANVISEAIAAGVPVLASHIPGSIGLLGAAYAGYYPVGDTKALADLLDRAETDSGFYNSLKAWCGRLRSLVRPARERESWRRLLSELKASSNSRLHRRGTRGR
jgi:putative glycosyltransferase (TIGR04348 family)